MIPTRFQSCRKFIIDAKTDTHVTFANKLDYKCPYCHNLIRMVEYTGCVGCSKCEWYIWFLFRGEERGVMNMRLGEDFHLTDTLSYDFPAYELTSVLNELNIKSKLALAIAPQKKRR